MDESIRQKMKNSARVFKRIASYSDDEWITDNYYILERHALQAADECRLAQKLLKGSDSLPGLFMRCRDLCEKGVLPEEEKIIAFFGESGLSGVGAEFLPLAITCALINTASESAASGDKSRAKLLANSVTSLRRMAETDFEHIAEKLCVSESVLLSDPSGIYRSMDSESKSVYRRCVSLGARARGIGEKEFALNALEKAQKNSEHIGKYIVKHSESRKGFVFLAFEAVMPLAASFAVSILFKNIWVGFLLFFPLWELMRYPIESASMKGVTPKRFFRISTDDSRVTDAHTLITVSTLMPAASNAAKLEKKLEDIYLSNCAGNIRVCCLADFKAADMPQKPEDKIMLKAAKAAVSRLNEKYGGGFILAVRPRVFSKTQGEFIGRERKRGAITELVRAIKGNRKGFIEIFGDTDSLEEVRYLIALDDDTQLVFDSARELVSIAEHPLNAPVVRNGRVTEGYGILVPKTENRLENGSLFARIMAGDTGITAYDSLSCERYQDLFGEGIFSGKGLINVDAFYKTLDSTLPEESVLSHDIVESGFLRAGFVSDVQITDSFPQSPDSYYRRLHRWVRGDWQNIRFIFGKNPLNFVSRYKMLDNLRRSLVPACCLAALMYSLFVQGNPGVAVAVISLISLAARNLYAGINALISGGFRALSGLYFSKTLPDALGCFLRAFVSVVYSARESFVCLNAAASALWRLFVSKKKLLEWTTAAQSEKINKVSKRLFSCIPSVFLGSILIFWGLPVHRLAGLIIWADILLTFCSRKKAENAKTAITAGSKDVLMSYAGAMWDFFDELCDKSNNFLPPDNIQLSPSRAVANRTSPTNIGLMLVSFLAARDFGFITSEELFMRLNLSLSTIEKLEKYKGNLLNWYDTVTLEPLEPRFVSAVDSGNLLCCLTALKEGLCEYLSECPRLEEIIRRAELIIENTELAPMYNKKKRLFYIGISPDDGRKSQSCYDLYMSEMRMTAYFAVARRQVPKSHWGAMGRILVGQGRYTGLASWTGTMFEYFMPALFIPSPEGSLSAESLRFCLHCQRKKAGKRPFGTSESGFYAFDGNLNYQYKAHGVQRLGLRRELDKEYVVSPYSSFLTMSIAPKTSIKNLIRLEKMGMTGKYGFYEAVDFTKGRTNGDFSIVRSFMSHHVGMSFISLDNFLNNDCMQKRFMNDRFMKGARSLLDEKIQSGARVFKDIKADETCHIREKNRGKNVISQSPSPFLPKAALYSNGRMTLCLTDCGTGVTLFDGIDATVNSGDLLMRPQGIFAVFVTEGEIIPFVAALNYGSKADFSCEFQKSKAVFTAKQGNIGLYAEAFVLKNNNCEIRRFSVENTGSKEKLCGKLIVYSDLCLEKRSDYSAHPAFSKLFLTDEWDDENKCCLFERNAAEGRQVCATAAGFIENIPLTHERNREKVLSTPDGVFSLGKKTEFKAGRGNPDCCCAFCADISVEPGEKKTLNFALAVEESKEQALNTLITVRSMKKPKSAFNPFHSDSLESAVSSQLLPKVMYPVFNNKCSTLGDSSVFTKQDLWSLGISGDLPIILVCVESEEEIETIKTYVRLNKVLRSCGLPSDLVIAFENEDGYLSPVTQAVKRVLSDESCTLMQGVKGGIHAVNLSSHGYSQRRALYSYASYIAGQDKMNENEASVTFKPLKKVNVIDDKKEDVSEKMVKVYNFTEGKITIDKTPATVDIPWSMVFANKSFGTMVSDKALGFTWAINSRENKLTPWFNDTMTDNRGEILFLKYNGVFYDITALGRAEFTPEKAAWTAEVSGLKIKAEISIPEKGMVKKCSVLIDNSSGSIRTFELMYFALPVLGVSRERSACFFVKKSDNAAVCSCSDSDVKGYMALSCSETPDYFCFSRKDFFEGHLTSKSDVITSDCCISVGRKISLAAGGKTSVSFFLSWGATEKAALTMPKVSCFGNRMLNPFTVNTPDTKLNLFFNSFLYSQVKQSRFFARTGFYQCSGAYGFRDQLQDCLAFIESEPKLTLTHLYRCAAVQFEQGDVLHWWHVTVDKTKKIRGVRTKCSDDMLWLPYACAVYRRKTGDSSFFNTVIPYICADELNCDEKERYIAPKRSEIKESLLWHCIKAVDYSMQFGKNSLPLIGSCDWNDGFSNMGNAESVWLAMFLKIVLDEMAEICNEFGMSQKAEEYKSVSAGLSAAVEDKAWLGDRYARVILGNGDFLNGDKDFIDILPQAFAVFADIGTPEKRDTALSTALNRLFDEENGVIRLLTPAFSAEQRNETGYIASYPAGLRENSGQYTHAAVWLALALLKYGRKEEGMRLLSKINPLGYYGNKELACAYRAEPFVLAGDVSYGEEIISRAGWTHFTGSAAWFYRCIFENFGEYLTENPRSCRIQEKCSCKASKLDQTQKTVKNKQNKSNLTK
ncbi:MAG: hypothetical protein IJO03_08995 [Clostridia bacterium]|nr:hypothetical protein [Clostridia bacterium]